MVMTMLLSFCTLIMQMLLIALSLAMCVVVPFLVLWLILGILDALLP